MHVIITTTAIDALVIFIPFLVGKNIETNVPKLVHIQIQMERIRIKTAPGSPSSSAQEGCNKGGQCVYSNQGRPIAEQVAKSWPPAQASLLKSSCLLFASIDSHSELSIAVQSYQSWDIEK